MASNVCPFELLPFELCDRIVHAAGPVGGTRLAIALASSIALRRMRGRRVHIGAMALALLKSVLRPYGMRAGGYWDSYDRGKMGWAFADLAHAIMLGSTLAGYPVPTRTESVRENYLQWTFREPNVSAVKIRALCWCELGQRSAHPPRTVVSILGYEARRYLSRRPSLVAALTRVFRAATALLGWKLEAFNLKDFNEAHPASQFEVGEQADMDTS